jgi:hypothetical protein
MSTPSNISAGLTELLDGHSRYDLLLAVLPLPLCLGVLTSLLTGTPPAIGAGLGGLPSALLLAYGLFYDAPTPARDRVADGQRPRRRRTA